MLQTTGMNLEAKKSADTYTVQDDIEVTGIVESTSNRSSKDVTNVKITKNLERTKRAQVTWNKRCLRSHHGKNRAHRNTENCLQIYGLTGNTRVNQIFSKPFFKCFKCSNTTKTAHLVALRTKILNKGISLPRRNKSNKSRSKNKNTSNDEFHQDEEPSYAKTKGGNIFNESGHSSVYGTYSFSQTSVDYSSRMQRSRRHTYSQKVRNKLEAPKTVSINLQTCDREIKDSQIALNKIYNSNTATFLKREVLSLKNVNDDLNKSKNNLSQLDISIGDQEILQNSKCEIGLIRAELQSILKEKCWIKTDEPSLNPKGTKHVYKLGNDCKKKLITIDPTKNSKITISYPKRAVSSTKTDKCTNANIIPVVRINKLAVNKLNQNIQTVPFKTKETNSNKPNICNHCSKRTRNKSKNMGVVYCQPCHSHFATDPSSCKLNSSSLVGIEKSVPHQSHEKFNKIKAPMLNKSTSNTKNAVQERKLLNLEITHEFPQSGNIKTLPPRGPKPSPKTRRYVAPCQKKPSTTYCRRSPETCCFLQTSPACRISSGLCVAARKPILCQNSSKILLKTPSAALKTIQPPTRTLEEIYLDLDRIKTTLESKNSTLTEKNKALIHKNYLLEQKNTFLSKMLSKLQGLDNSIKVLDENIQYHIDNLNNPSFGVPARTTNLTAHITNPQLINLNTISKTIKNKIPNQKQQVISTQLNHPFRSPVDKGLTNKQEGTNYKTRDERAFHKSISYEPQESTQTLILDSQVSKLEKHESKILVDFDGRNCEIKQSSYVAGPKFEIQPQISDFCYTNEAKTNLMEIKLLEHNYALASAIPPINVLIKTVPDLEKMSDDRNQIMQQKSSIVTFETNIKDVENFQSDQKSISLNSIHIDPVFDVISPQQCSKNKIFHNDATDDKTSPFILPKTNETNTVELTRIQDSLGSGSKTKLKTTLRSKSVETTPDNVDIFFKDNCKIMSKKWSFSKCLNFGSNDAFESDTFDNINEQSMLQIYNTDNKRTSNRYDQNSYTDRSNEDIQRNGYTCSWNHDNIFFNSCNDMPRNHNEGFDDKEHSNLSCSNRSEYEYVENKNRFKSEPMDDQIEHFVQTELGLEIDSDRALKLNSHPPLVLPDKKSVRDCTYVSLNPELNDQAMFNLSSPLKNLCKPLGSYKGDFCSYQTLKSCIKNNLSLSNVNGNSYKNVAAECSPQNIRMKPLNHKHDDDPSQTKELYCLNSSSRSLPQNSISNGYTRYLPRSKNISSAYKRKLDDMQAQSAVNEYQHPVASPPEQACQKPLVTGQSELRFERDAGLEGGAKRWVEVGRNNLTDTPYEIEKKAKACIILNDKLNLNICLNIRGLEDQGEGTVHQL